jgi:hypothetical protein
MTDHLTALRGWRDNPWTMRVGLLLTAAALLVSLAWRFGSGPAEARKPYQVPQDARLEASLGIRFTEAAVVADGGLVELRYTVLDTQRASNFQNDVQHPPVIYGQDRRKPVYRTALMKQGHTLRPGQTYFILYENNSGAVHTGGTLEIDAGNSKLVNVPVR